MEIINIKNLSFKYSGSDEYALSDISLKINKGEFAVICGKSGCGKSTLLKLIKREMSPNGEISGEILYLSKNLNEISDLTSACEIGYVLQNTALWSIGDTVQSELAFGLESIGLDPQIIKRRIAEISTFFGLSAKFEEKTDNLSGGQIQLLALAGTIAMRPKLLLLDEPTSQLDPISAAEFLNTLKRINKELGITIILIEHRLEDVFSLANRIIVMENGRIISNETPRNTVSALNKVKQNHPFISALPCSSVLFSNVGLPNEICPINTLEGQIFLAENFNSDIKRIENSSADETNSLNKNKAVEIKDVWFRYSKNSSDILRGTDITAYYGEILSILGGNGSGKTTLLNVMAGLSRFYRGNVLINGKKIKSYSKEQLYRQNISYLPQNPCDVFIKSTVFEDYMDITKNSSSATDAESSAIKMLERLNILHLKDRHPYDLSGGEQQLSALGKILLTKPKILFLDEPTKSIDYFSKQNLKEILISLKNEGIAIVLVTHDIEFSAEVSNKCALFFAGGIVSEDVPSKFFSESEFYTTSAAKISGGIFENAVLTEDLINLCIKNGRIIQNKEL